MGTSVFPDCLKGQTVVNFFFFLVSFCFSGHFCPSEKTVKCKVKKDSGTWSVVLISKTDKYFIVLGFVWVLWTCSSPAFCSWNFVKNKNKGVCGGDILPNACRYKNSLEHRTCENWEVYDLSNMIKVKALILALVSLKEVLQRLCEAVVVAFKNGFVGKCGMTPEKCTKAWHKMKVAIVFALCIYKGKICGWVSWVLKCGDLQAVEGE